MRKRLSLLLTLVLLLGTWKVMGQQVDQSSPPSVSDLPTAPSVLFNKVLVYLREGGALSGLLVGIESNALILRINGQNEKIQLNNLARVIIDVEKKTSRNTLYGMLMGAYLGNLILHRAKNHPAAYMQDTEAGIWLFLWEVALAAAGGGIGYLSGAILEKGEKVFDFTGSKEKQLSERERLRRYIIGGFSRLRKMNFSVQAGHIFTRVANRYMSLLKNADYHASRYICQDNECGDAASNFNFLRKLQISYSLKSNTEIGLALYWLGEPSVQGEKWQDGISSEVTQTLYSTGYYAICVYKPFLKRMPKQISWNVGVGFGAAKVNFNLKTSSHSWYPYFEEKTENNISKILFSTIIFTELNLWISEALSLGLISDYVFVPSEQGPEFLEEGIPAQKLRLGNGSLGFTLGLHF